MKKIQLIHHASVPSTGSLYKLYILVHALHRLHSSVLGWDKKLERVKET